jgi:hypothetical protein
MSGEDGFAGSFVMFGRKGVVDVPSCRDDKDRENPKLGRRRKRLAAPLPTYEYILRNQFAVLHDEGPSKFMSATDL